MEAVIVDCVRTAVGKAPRGALRNVRPDDLGAAAIAGLLRRHPAAKDAVEDVILGCAMPEGKAGNNIARMAALRAGLPQSVSAVTINRFCASGLEAIAMAADRVRAGSVEVVVAGGAESMSSTAFGRDPAPNPWFADHCPEIYMTMGLTAERLQKKYGIAREDADEYALRSHQKALHGIGQGHFEEEIVPVEVEEGTPSGRRTFEFTRDEGPRGDTNLQALLQLRPVFHAKGTVTAGNSSQTSDGAAAALVMSERKARELGLRPMARFVSYATAGVAPEVMGIGPVAAIPKALEKAGLKLADIGVVELNEAFAVQAIAVVLQAGLDWRKVNPNGGAIALGHPLGCTGAKLTATILREMRRRRDRYGMVTMCVGGGQGAAGVFESLR